MSYRHLSKVTLPQAEKPYPTITAFLIKRFPRIPPIVWEERIRHGKILDKDQNPVNAATGYLPGKTIYYFREVENEPEIPFAEEILFQNGDLIVCCKPHFLPVNPTGPYVAECLQSRLIRRTGNDDLVPVNRIDRETAGIVIFSASRKTRDLYYRLFREGKVEKGYEALAACAVMPERTEWRVATRMVPGEPWFRMKNVAGEPNAISIIKLAEVKGGVGRFLLTPLTGKTHQLRLHMSGLGFGILNDRLYPDLQPERADDYEKPLQLIARMVRFRDPVTDEMLEFVSERPLLWR